ncbi:MAG: hypothetical protein JW958_03495 [Candidatus Eisenbacteria bacterium]|nr:hypothetical protein [Candidatus Eisenbacteria bacterium]
MQRKRNGNPFLIKASPNSTFDILLKKAEQEGRLGGKHRCAICGMSHQSKQEATECCAKLRDRQQLR